MTQAGRAKFGRDILLGGWDNHAPGLSTKSTGKGIRLDGDGVTQPSCTRIGAPGTRRCQGGGLDFPVALDPPPRARPAMVYQSLWEREEGEMD